ncbi:hypothetical protein EJ06DRAFT_532028 [Trichodelitschia bisporula]|uniref:Protein-S-isoprenylcysteine O-methyltransferase n=1 Tax=Trichodelitschia bisporula TaxID=703511 RepID=A0A6G1HQV2_9PEZI|nr:hypothetical protein EJ06DRAFT_532028 [Trichodelitschia bisporula]
MLITLIISTIHLAFATLWTFPTLLSGEAVRLIFWHPELLNPRRCTWNAGTIFWLALMIGGSAVRLIAYAQLGSAFTFELARPAGLVTDGLYALCQHPSYVPDLAAMVGAVGLWGNVDGGWANWAPFGLVW